MGRGCYEQLFSNDGRLCIVRWLDNKPVNLISTYIEATPLSKVNRWSKVSQSRVDVDCPNIVREYNRNMGGVDLANMLLSSYRIDRRSKKYFNRIIYYLLGVWTPNAWIIYKHNHPSEKLALREFWKQLSLSLVRAGKPATVIKTGAQYNRSKTPVDLRFDRIDHIPIIKERQRCKMAGCALYLCIVTGKIDRNCFFDYHTQ